MRSTVLILLIAISSLALFGCNQKDESIGSAADSAKASAPVVPESNTTELTGHLVIKPQFGLASDFSEGLAQVRIGGLAGKSGFIDKQGQMVINPQFDNFPDFSEGLAQVLIGDDETGKWGFIDKQGKMVINPQFDYAGDFSEGLAKVLIEDGTKYNRKWGYISRR